MILSSETWTFIKDLSFSHLLEWGSSILHEATGATREISDLHTTSMLSHYPVLDFFSLMNYLQCIFLFSYLTCKIAASVLSPLHF